MKLSGWNMFIALLIADAVGGLMGLIGIDNGYCWLIGVIVFVIVAVLLTITSYRSQQSKKREAAAAAKIADLENIINEGGDKR